MWGYLYYYKKEDRGIQILRIFGKSSVIHLPEEIERLPVRRLAPYLFSKMCRERPEQQEGVKICAMDLGNQEIIVKEADPIESGLRELCGEEVEEIALPSRLQEIGKYAFYGCFNLYKLCFFSSIADIGTGAFTGCKQIQELSVQIVPKVRSCLSEMLSELSQKICVDYYENNEHARLIFPEFYEEAVENTPARILVTHMHGAGHRYRYCFHGKDFQFLDYDALFQNLKAEEHSKEVILELALCRMFYPLRLSKRSEKEYRSYLFKEFESVAEYLLKKRNISSLQTFILLFDGKEGAEEKWKEEDFERLLQIAGAYKSAELVSFLMEEKHIYYPAKRKRFIL